MTVLVSGATGNVGSEVVRACSAAGMRVRVAGSRLSVLEKRYPDLERVELDFTRKETWPSALRGASNLFLMRPPSLANMRDTLLPFIDVALTEDCSHIVFLSVEGADKMKWVPHRKVEDHLGRVGANYTILRPGFFAQNLEGAYLRDIVTDHRLYVPAGSAPIAFIDAADIGDVTAAILRAPESYRNTALLLTGPEALTFSQVADILSRHVRCSVEYQPATALGYVWHLVTKHQLSPIQVLIQLILHLGLRKGNSSRVDPTLEDIIGRAGRTVDDYVKRSSGKFDSRH